MTAPSQASRVVEPASRWRTEADFAAVDRVAQAWESLAGRAIATADQVTRAANAVYGPGWQGEAADRYHEHRKKITGRLDDLGKCARKASSIVAGIRGTIGAAEGHLGASLGRASAVAKVNQNGASIVFEVPDEQAKAVVLGEVRQAVQIRNEMVSALQRHVAELRDLATAIRKLAVNLTEATYGGNFRNSAGEATKTSVMTVDKQVIVNTGSGDDRVEVRTDTSTGEVVIKVNGTEYRAPAGMQPVIRTGDGNDIVRVAPGTTVNLVILGGAGDDSLGSRGANDRGSSAAGDDTILGGAGNDFIHTGSGRNYASGGAGRDYLDGGTGEDTLRGGLGNDSIYGLDGRDRLSGGGDRDFLDGGRGDDRLFGGAGDDVTFGGRDADRVVAGAGDDRNFGGHGVDRADLGSGTDLSYQQADDTATEVERVVRVEYQPNLGLNFIRVEGSDEFRARVESDLESLRSVPGHLMLREFDRIHTSTATTGYTGDMLRIVEGGANTASYSDNPVVGRTYVIEYNPERTFLPDGRGERVPLSGLYHEGAHIYQFNRGPLDATPNAQYDGSSAPNYERAAAGLTVDHDNNPATSPQQDPNLPEGLSQNWLHRLFGHPERPIY